MFRLLRSSIRSQVAAAAFGVERPSDGVVIFSMNLPKTRNAFSKAQITSMEEAVQSVKFDPTIRALVIRSMVKGAFCAGADLKERVQMTPEEVGPFVARLRAMIREFRELPCATIAAIDGFALGGGLELACACDMRVCADTAKMGLTETRLAIIPGGGGTQTLTRIVGAPKAKELIFSARLIDGNYAEKIGLSNRTVPQNDQGDAAFHSAVELANEIAPQGPIALRMAKIAINKGSEVDLYSGLAYEENCYAQVIPTEDRIEGLMAFKEKRKPKYQGK